MTDLVELNAGGFPVRNASYWKLQYDSVCKQLAECQAQLAKRHLYADDMKKQWQREALLDAIDCARNAYESGDVLEKLIKRAKELE
jgi:hypothetical protein